MDGSGLSSSDVLALAKDNDGNTDLQNALNQQVTINSNLQQTQQIVGQILGNAGRFVAWAPSGSADATKVVTTAG